MDKTVRSGHRKVKKLFAKQKKIRQTQRPKEIPSYQSPSSKTKKASLLEVCSKSHRAGRQRTRTAPKQTEEVLQLHQTAKR